ncbi:DEAD/DEAH box helicase [Aequorivita sp. H23M31]|uniref:DEAD/DEAH box helicase n=1 Tax=Aequorivita ciconiae TaxID=2494375 RepID=A0A410FZT6_9FLAO|nr:DEAD/DEAH box helicase [Aequorivita sp. H23M31]QAA80542.1 DEAD/DEAH box helicase [Aequorivita sp. H23M31]
MPFKKLNPELQKTLTSLEMTTPTLFESKSIPVIKSGANVYCVAPKDSGKTSTLIITTLQKLKYRAIGNVPRAVALVESKEEASELYNLFLEYLKTSDLRIYLATEEIHVDIQKSEIAMGIDILISTPISMNKLFLSNGINTSEVKILSVDDAEFLIQKSHYSAIMLLTRSIKKCQYVLYMEKMEPMLKRFKDYFMEFAKTVVVKERVEGEENEN